MSYNDFLKPKLLPLLLAVLTMLSLNYSSRKIIENFSERIPLSSSDVEGYSSRYLKRTLDGKSVFAFGGSSLRQAIDDDLVMNKKLGNVKFYNLSTSGMSIVDAYILARNIDIKKGDLILLHFSIARINKFDIKKSFACGKYPFSTIFPSDINVARKELGIVDSLIDNHCYFSLLSSFEVLSRVLSSFVTGQTKFEKYFPMSYERFPAKLENRREQRRKNQYNDEFNKYQFQFDEAVANKNFEVIKKLNELLLSKGAKLLVLDLPQNVDWFQRYHGKMDSDFIKPYKKYIHRIKDNGIAFYDFRKNEKFSYENFYDHIHMIQTGRDIFFPMLKKMITREID